MIKRLIIFFCLFLVSSQAFSALSGSALFKGQVTRVVSLVVTAEPIAASLDLTASKSNLLVATINEKSNSKTGYKMTISSANRGKLKRVDGPELFTYTMKLNGSNVNLSQVAGTTFTRSTSRPVNINRNLKMSYVGKLPELMVQGTYADTITITIAAR
ncbi:MAG: hypothetical protein KBD76_11250 [Bacteriovorax sp.]|nr:hypothetical protein [Bacteriovorax sp.]